MSEATIRFKRRTLPYTQIANAALRDKTLPLAVRGFFALMLSLPDSTDRTVSYFAKAGGISKDTVYKYFGILEESGYLTREQQHGNGGKFAPNVYDLNDTPCRKKPCTVLPDTEEPCTEKSDTKERTLTKNTPIAPTGGESDAEKKTEAERAMLFNRFWACYPRKVNKQAARRAWEKLKPDLLLCSQMSQALKRQMASEEWQRDGGRYIPHPSTWLNGRRWEDEDVAPSAPAASPAPRETAREEDQWLA